MKIKFLVLSLFFARFIGNAQNPISFIFTDLHSEILLDPVKFENDFITPPTDPGLGIELN